MNSVRNRAQRSVQAGARRNGSRMRRGVLMCLSVMCGTAAVISLALMMSRTLSFSDVRTLASGVFFVDSSTPEGLTQKYAQAMRGGNRVRIMIVPGHDNESSGTEFRGVREADMNAAVGAELMRLLSADFAYAPVLVRTEKDYTPDILSYFAAKRGDVRAHVANKRKLMNDLLAQGKLRSTRGVLHNFAESEVAEKLYAMNLFANEYQMDVVIHIHFNDYYGRSRSRAGRYEGFALYVPDPQYSNAKGSRAIAETLQSQFSKFYAESNLPQENEGVVPDQELIALGSYNTLDPASVLIEYGYIYEPRFQNKEIREAFLKELAFQTYVGLNRFFGNATEVFRTYPTTFLPHQWSESLSEGDKHHPSVLSLQAALLMENLYPPDGNKQACPLTGSFGPCTERAVIAFQKKYGISPASGAVGASTLQKLNELYSR